MIDKRTISAYTPSNTDPETRERILVQHHKLLDRIVRWREESMLTGDKHHLLFIGPRGCGKTHLVSMAHYRLSNKTKLNDKMRIAWLGEDSVFTGLIDFALEIADELAIEYPDEFGFDSRNMSKSLPADDAAELILGEIASRLGDRSILLIMENLDRAFLSLGDLGQKKWRAFLQENGRVATLATSQNLFDMIAEAMVHRGMFYWFSSEFEAALSDYTAVVEFTGISSTWKTNALFCIPVAMIPIRSLDEVVESLKRAFIQGELETRGYSGFERDILRMIMGREHFSWPGYIEAIVPIYAKYGALNSLGSGLTQSIETLDTGGYSEAQIDLWNSSWKRFGAEYEELSIVLSSLYAAVQVIKTGSDRPLFDLPLEIRKIVRSLLKQTLSKDE